MIQKLACRILIFIAVYAFPGLVLSTDIWTLKAYRACLENEAMPLPTLGVPYKLVVPYQYQSIKPRKASECNRLIDLYRAAFAVENESEDSCFSSRSHSISVSSSWYVIAEPDMVLANCKSKMKGDPSPLSQPNVKDLETFARSIHPDNDDKVQKVVQAFQGMITNKLERITTIAHLQQLDYIGWEISLRNSDFWYEEYNLSFEDE